MNTVPSIVRAININSAQFGRKHFNSGQAPQSKERWEGSISRSSRLMPLAIKFDPLVREKQRELWNQLVSA
jgi:hypothetical protein